MRWFCGRLPEPPLGPAPGWRAATAAEAEAWVLGQDESAEDREMRRLALDGGHTLLVAEREGRVVGRRWLGSGWVYIPEPVWCRVRFPPGVAYFYDVHVEPAHRGQGVGRGAVASGVHEALARGFTSCASLVAVGNGASLHNWMRLGVPFWDVTRLVASRRGLWWPRAPWRRLGVTAVERWVP